MKVMTERELRDKFPRIVLVELGFEEPIPPCDVCGHESPSRRGMGVHKRAKHGIDVPREREAGYPCPCPVNDCTRRFETAWGVWVHVCKAHPKIVEQFREYFCVSNPGVGLRRKKRKIANIQQRPAHSNNYRIPEAEATYEHECPMVDCTRRFKNEKGVISHMGHIHPKKLRSFYPKYNKKLYAEPREIPLSDQEVYELMNGGENGQ